jgi:hypothetical protein
METDSVGTVTGNGVSPAGVGRREWELSERVTDLEAQLAEQLERERIRELEIISLRRELEVRFAYNSMLEHNALERQKEIDWLKHRVEHDAQVLANERVRAAEEHRLAAEERERAAEELAAQCGRTLEAHDAWEQAQKTLAAERNRLSYRMSNRAVSWLTGHGVLFAVVRRAGGTRSRTPAG